MIVHSLRKLLGQTRPRPRAARAPAGERIYAIGDIHGRLDLFDALIEAIEQEEARRPKANTSVILLGDLIDRGPDSAGVLRRAREWQAHRNVRILKGNHEDMLLGALADERTLAMFLRNGGRATLRSYGFAREQIDRAAPSELMAQMKRLIPESDIAFIKSFELMILAGDYAFVHAGINPALPLDQQKPQELMWIRHRFIDHTGPLPKVVVHGHTIFERPGDFGNRIAIDTGAWCHGRLTALLLEGEERETIAAIGSGDAIETIREGLHR